MLVLYMTAWWQIHKVATGKVSMSHFSRIKSDTVICLKNDIKAGSLEKHNMLRP